MENGSTPRSEVAGEPTQNGSLPLSARLLGVVDPLVLLVALADGAVKVDDKIAELVAHARASGKSWTEIGQALGITKQSAWEKYSGED